MYEHIRLLPPPPPPPPRVRALTHILIETFQFSNEPRHGKTHILTYPEAILQILL